MDTPSRQNQGETGTPARLRRFAEAKQMFAEIEKRAPLGITTSSNKPATSSKAKPSTLSNTCTTLPQQTAEVACKLVLPSYVCPFGEFIAVVGSSPQLGAWDVTEALPMQWHEGSRWELEVMMPVSTTTEYKFVLCDSEGHVLLWEPGCNATLHVSSSNVVATRAWGVSEPTVESWSSATTNTGAWSTSNQENAVIA